MPSLFVRRPDFVKSEGCFVVACIAGLLSSFSWSPLALEWKKDH